MFLIQLYADETNRLQAINSLQQIMEIAVGTGSTKDGPNIRRSLVRQAYKSRAILVRPDPSALGAIGIGFERWQRN